MRVNRKDREAEFALEQGGVKVIGKAVVGETPGQGVHGDAGEWGEQGGEGKGLGMICILDGKEQCGGLVMGINAALESAQDCGLNKLFGGGFRGGGKEQVMGCDEQGEEVVICTDERGGVECSGPRGERAGIDWLEFPVIARARVDAADGKAEGPCQGNKECGDGGIGMVTEAEAAFTDGDVGKEPRKGRDRGCRVSKVVEEEIGGLVDGQGKRGVPSREGRRGKEVGVEEDISW
jgi:hypothetical protein